MRVEISGCGATVEIEVDDADVTLDTVAAKARELWREARTESRAGGPAFGFSAPIAVAPGRDRRRPAADPVRGSGHQHGEHNPAGDQGDQGKG